MQDKGAMVALSRVAWPASTGAGRLARDLVLAVAGSLVLWLSAKARVPFWPVPLTMQTFVVLLIGMAYGWRLGATTVALYLAQGAVGLPVFAGTPERGIGLAYMLGPTGGYLLGCLAAAALVGGLAEHGWDRRPATTALAMILGLMVIYGLGVLWLGGLVGYARAIEVGVAPFLLADALKVAIATVLFPTAWRLLRRTEG